MHDHIGEQLLKWRKYKSLSDFNDLYKWPEMVAPNVHGFLVPVD